MSNALNRRLTHTCVIWRSAQSENELNETVETYSPFEMDVPCRFVEKQERVFSDERAEWVTVPVKLLLFRADQDVQEKDRFTNVALDDGVELEGVYAVDGDLLRRNGRRSAHHISVKVRRLLA